MASPIASLGDVSNLPLGFKVPKTPTVWETNPVLSYFNDFYKAVAARRQALNLTNPGTLENINKEVSKDVFLNNYFFTGLRADLTKSFSMSPAFQVSHSFSLGSPVMPPYAFAAFYATDNVFLQGNVDNDLSVSGRLHYGWDKYNTTKANVQIANAQPAMLQLEHDFQASDFSLNFKTLNPSILDGGFTGVAVGSILQSVSSKLALGLEAVYSSQSPLYPPDAAVSYVARYDAKDWIASAQLQAQGAILASFWRRVTDKVEAGIETSISAGGSQQAMMMGAPPSVEASTTLGAKYEFRQSVFRGQIDSAGKVSCLLERRVLPVVSVIFAGEIDHAKSTARLGLGLQFEAGGEETFQQQVDPNDQPHPPM
ncbi:Tom40p [Sugiyamaella lignohabitans]|uniref:Translocase of outer membrane 40 kDa subunit n=1 Tax=Sugiyamaella lignohabitans TaxID=796027 RepID=A0A167CW79_9ASCO|nr:Tom40p [Sugiyamaella lignohabitans]ANB12176.1 Tom40p [Sugiyamaella lignohabitans]